MPYTRPKEKVRARKVRDDIFLVRTGKRSYRIAIVKHKGTGYSNFSGIPGVPYNPVGLTGMKELEFISEKSVSLNEAYHTLFTTWIEYDDLHLPKVLDLEL